MADHEDTTTNGMNHSTGRGGAGNIGKGEGTYADADIVREGVLGKTGRINESEYSAGRGGAGNIIHDPNPSHSKSQPPAVDNIPETATVPPYADYHTGRGGEGNIHRDRFGGHTKPQTKEQADAEGHHSVIEKAKHVLGVGGK